MRLKEDSTSWKSRSIMRRDFRHDPGLPEDEVPRRSHPKGKNKKHVHDYKPGEGSEIVKRYSFSERRFIPVAVTSEVCRGCGHKRVAGRWYY